LSAPDRPLITLAIRHYNNAAFVAEALAAAFAQTYSPLEIVFIDDASTDGGWEIAQRLIENYRGPHRIVVARNPTRLGVGGQYDRVRELAKGEIFVFADADDISLPQRCQRIHEAFRDGGAELLGVISHYDIIASDGTPFIELPSGFGAARVDAAEWTAEDLAHERSGPSGAAAAFRRTVFELGTPLTGLQHSEDLICGFRCLLRGRLATIPEVLLHRRAHLNNLSGPIHPEWGGSQLAAWVAKTLRAKVLIPGVMKRDIALFEGYGMISPSRATTLRHEIMLHARSLKLLRISTRGGLGTALHAYSVLRKGGLSLRLSARLVLQTSLPSIAMIFLRRNPLIRARGKMKSERPTPSLS